MNGTLFVCATPIGNLSDCSPRLLETLSQAHLIAAEDTRITSRLLAHFNIKTPLLSLHQHNEAQRVHLIKTHLAKGEHVALVSDAGTPNISDPGALLVNQLSQEGFSIVPIAGPSAITALLSIAGILANHFLFTGFFPKKESEAQAALDHWKVVNSPIVCFETSLRLEKTLTWLDHTQQVDHMVLAKELSKQYETVYRGTPHEILKALKENSIKGEWCFVITLFPQKTESDSQIGHVVEALKQEGLSTRQILHVAKLLQYPKNKVYDFIHTAPQKGPL